MEVKINDMNYCECASVAVANDQNSCDILFNSPEQMQDFIREACDKGVQSIQYGDVILTVYFTSLECM